MEVLLEVLKWAAIIVGGGFALWGIALTLLVLKFGRIAWTLSVYDKLSGSLHASRGLTFLEIVQGRLSDTFTGDRWKSYFTDEAAKLALVGVEKELVDEAKPGMVYKVHPERRLIMISIPR